MLKPSKNHLALISSNELTLLEEKITALESAVPIELKIVLDNSLPSYPVGGLRAIVCILAFLTILFYYLWISLPIWIFPLFILFSLFIPADKLGTFPLARTFSSKKEEEAGLIFRSRVNFEKLSVHATTHRNGVLLYISMFERKFYLLPDIGARSAWQEKDWQEWAQNLANALSNKRDSSRIFNGVSVLINELKLKAQKLKEEPTLISEKLSNSVVIL